MGIYIFELMIIWAFGFLYHEKVIKKEKFVFFTVMLLSLVSGLRGIDVGEDTQFFYNMFNHISQVSWKEIFTSGTSVVYNTLYGVDFAVETGYAILNKTISMFTSNPQWLIVTCAFITNILIGRFILKTSDNVFMAIYIYTCESMYMHSFSLIRQFVAIAIAIQAYELIKQKKYINGLIVILLACSFHTSAIVMLGLFPLMMPKNHVKSIKYVFVVAIISLFSTTFMKNIINSISYLDKYSEYFEKNIWEGSVHAQALLWLSEIIICVIICFIYRNDLSTKKNCYIAVAGTLIYLAFEVIGLRISAFQRIAIYYNIFIVFLFPYFASKFKTRSRMILCIGIYFVMTVAFFRAASLPVRSYRFFWQ